MPNNKPIRQHSTSREPMIHRTVRFPSRLYQKIMTLKDEEMRSFNEQVIYMLTQYEGIKNGENNNNNNNNNAEPVEEQPL